MNVDRPGRPGSLYASLMLTRLEVIDDAVKIGLGAAITLAGLVLTSRHQRISEIRKRRLDTIEKTSVEFGGLSEVFTRLQALYGTYLRFFLANDPDSAEGLEELRTQIKDMFTKEVNPAVLGLMGLRSRLIVISADHSAQALNQFIEAATAMQYGVFRAEGVSSERTLLTEWKGLVEVFSVAQRSFLTH